MTENFTITNFTKSTLPRVPFAAMKDKALGPSYELSLVFVGEARSQRLNGAYRGKDKPTDILSFSVSDYSGEIFICPSIARRKMKEFDRNFSNFIAFLFIHGCMHLKGFDHGSKMEAAEEKLRTYFKI